MTELGVSSANGRMLHIDRAKGLGIALVVYGHLVKSGTYGVQDWYSYSKDAIYGFHMPFFMYLSGLVFFASNAPDKFYANIANYIGKRADRLLVPFVIFGLIVVLGKFLAASFTQIDDGVSELSGALWSVIANLPGNPSISIWYLLVLFVYSLVTPLLWRTAGRRIWLLLGLGAILWLFRWPEVFYIRRIAQFFLFFILGGYVALHRETMLKLFRRYWLAALSIFAVAIYIALGHRYALLVLGLLSIPALHGLMLQPIWDRDWILLTIGSCSMAIYLMNTIFIGVGKAIYVRALPYAGDWFVLFVLFLFVVGMIGPMFVKFAADRWRLPLRRCLA